MSHQRVLTPVEHARCAALASVQKCERSEELSRSTVLEHFTFNATHLAVGQGYHNAVDDSRIQTIRHVVHGHGVGLTVDANDT